ncbi:MAG: hypothetical protein LBO05_08430 [Deltaproteobacteria bacterium]|nr:hypothetical protein [Deltaproteobacteria bacterium]
METTSAVSVKIQGRIYPLPGKTEEGGEAGKTNERPGSARPGAPEGPAGEVDGCRTFATAGAPDVRGDRASGRTARASGQAAPTSGQAVRAPERTITGGAAAGPTRSSFNPMEAGGFRHFGVQYFFSQIVRQLDIESNLKYIFSFNYEFINNFLFFLLSTNKQLEEIGYWLEDNTDINRNLFSFTKLTSLINNILPIKRESFFKNWNRRHNEIDFVLVETKSILRQSADLGRFAEAGQSANQVGKGNIVTLYGRDSLLPVCQHFVDEKRTYGQVLADVCGMLEKDFDCRNANIFLTEDFYSLNFLKELLDENKVNFALRAPATDRLVLDIIKSASGSIDSASNYIATGSAGETVRGLKIVCDLEAGLPADFSKPGGGEDAERKTGTEKGLITEEKVGIAEEKLVMAEEKWGMTEKNGVEKGGTKAEEEEAGENSGRLLRAYVYYNPMAALNERQSFFTNLNRIRETRQKDKLGLVRHTEYDRFLLFQDDGGIVINEAEVDKYLSKEGYFVILSNVDQAPQAIYDIYKIRNQIFDMNNAFIKHMSFFRFSYMAKTNYANTFFTIFLANIIFSHIYKIYINSDISKKYTLSNILSELNLLKSFKYKNIEYVNLPNTIQKEIFSSFSLPLPPSIV